MSRLGYAGGMWAPRVYTPPAPPPPPPPTIIYTSAPPVATRTILPRATSIPVYDQSRIFKDIKLVADLRQTGAERGEVQTGDNGTLGPGSIAPPLTVKPTAAPVTEKNNLVPIAIAIAAFLILGG